MRLALFSALVTLTAGFAAPAAAQEAQEAPPAVRNIGYITGTDLFRRCTETAQSSGAFCFGFIAGVHDSVRAYETWLTIREFCVPGTVSQGELRDTFLDYARSYPTTLEGQAASVVVAAFKRSFPCPTG